MNYLAIDYGTKKIGLAHSSQGIAFPGGVIPTSEALSRIAKIIQEKQITDIVIGIPNHITGEESHLTRLVRIFELELKKHFPNLPIHEYDERLSSAEATLSLEEAGHKKRRHEHIDDMAASIVLQSFLDSR